MCEALVDVDVGIKEFLIQWSSPILDLIPVDDRSVFSDGGRALPGGLILANSIPLDFIVRLAPDKLLA